MKARTYNPLPKVVGLAILAFALILCCGCNGKRVSAVERCPHDQSLRTYEQWRDSVTFPYVAGADKLVRVQSNYGRVAVGSTKEEVIQAFGAPDYEQELYLKGSGFCSSEFVYRFEQPDYYSTNNNDKNVAVYFTSAGKVKWVVGNVGLAEKGSPAHDTQR